MVRKHTPIHLRPHAAVAERVVVVGDPGRALRLAQVLADQPRMLNHHRGLWGYTGQAPDGRPITVQSTGMGGPSAALVVADLAALGARRLVRVGSCRAAGAPGRLVVPDEIAPRDGTSRALGATSVLHPDPSLAARLRAELPDAMGGGAVSLDVPAAPGAVPADLQSAAVLAAARRVGVIAAVALVVAETPAGRLGDEELHAAEATLGRAASAALA